LRQKKERYSVNWLELLEKAEKKRGTHNTPPSSRDTPQKAGGGHAAKTEKRSNELAERGAERASKLGLIARWSYEFGYVSLHDPTSGEWHDLPTKDAPAWAKREDFKRKELSKHHGIHRTLTASEMEKVWEEEQVEMWENPTVTDKGIVYGDYLDEE
jgi:hypothetical protein